MTPREKSRTLYGVIGNALLLVSTLIACAVMISGSIRSDLTFFLFCKRMIVPAIGVVIGFILADDDTVA